ncbi:MAG: IPT/TIG domain-containing protein, partial [Actinomycetes bacterium]
QAIDIVGTNLGDALGTSVVLYTAAAAGKAAVTTPVTVLSVNAAGTVMTIASPAVSQKGNLKITTGGGTASAVALFSSSSTNTSKPTITLTASLVKEVGSTFTLNGTNIASATSIKIGQISAPFSILTANSVVVTVPAGAVSGSTISATNLGGTVTSTKFVYQAAVVASRTAAARVGQTVTITGSNLVATSVIFGGNKSAKPVINNG